MVPWFPIEIMGSWASVSVEAAVDTCFEGDVCLPVDAAIQLGLELVSRQQVEYADGRVSTELVFAGQARFLGEVRPVRISLTEVEVTLIGTELMADCDLFVEFPTGRVVITKSAALQEDQSDKA
jgi:predicted aspartyl protease